MKVRNIIIAACAVTAMQSASALDVTTGLGGELSRLVKNPEQVTELSVNGPIDAGDFYFIGKEMKALKTLDLSGAVIRGIEGAVIEGRTAYAEGNIPPGAFAGLPLEKVTFPAEQRIVIDDAAFMNTAFTTLSLPENVDSIGNGAFASCRLLENVVMPSVSRIGSSVFADCTALREVDMNAVTVVPEAAFRGCTALAEVKGSENITDIGARAFEGDRMLTEFVFGPSLKSVGHSAFAASGLTEADLAASPLTELGAQAFADSDLSAVRLPDGLQHIGSSAFFGANGVTDMVLPESLIVMGSHAFVGTTLPSVIDFPSSLETIDDYALAGQDKVEKITFPATLSRIGTGGMENMTGLQMIYGSALPSVPELGDDVWAGVDQKSVTLTVSDLTIADFKNAPQWKEFSMQMASKSEDIISDKTQGVNLRGRFVGTELHIECDGADIAEVRLYDLRGALLTAVRPGATSVVVETAEYPGGVFVVDTLLDDGTRGGLKLARR